MSDDRCKLQATSLGGSQAPAALLFPQRVSVCRKDIHCLVIHGFQQV